MNFLAQLIVWINSLTNALGCYLLEPLSSLSGWLSNTIISAVTGVLLLLIFKYTSNQKAIGRVRDKIKAHLLSLKLFKDDIGVTINAQRRIFKGALLLLVHAIQPMLVMMVPVVLLLAQMGLWYQGRPLRPGERALVIMKLNEQGNPALPEVTLLSTPAAQVTIGPVRIESLGEIRWQIEAQQEGYHQLVFQVDQQQAVKELAVGGNFMRLSVQRPGWFWSDILMHPWEKPFDPEGLVQSVSIEYPERDSYTSGTDWWIIYFFVASMVFALIFKPFVKVRI